MRPLGFIEDSFKLPTCQGVEKLFKEFTTWELLSIAPDVVLDILDRPYRQYAISQTFLTSAMHDYIVQTTPKNDDMFEKRFGRENTNHIAYITSATKHYSWLKSAGASFIPFGPLRTRTDLVSAITGIGSKNLIDVTVDDDARMDMKHLRRQLNECLKAKRAVYAVVAIIGSTEHGACDPLKDIVDIRKEVSSPHLVSFSAAHPLNDTNSIKRKDLALFFMPMALGGHTTTRSSTRKSPPIRMSAPELGTRSTLLANNSP